jgi:triosephosphate isomerase
MIFAGNFKTNHTRASTAQYLEKLDNFLENKNKNCYIFPPYSALLPSTKNVIVGTQNIYPVKNGSFTGEIGLEQLEEFGIKTTMLGHSERRIFLGESNDAIREKFNFCMSMDFEIFLCIGESLETKEKGTKEIMSHLEKQLWGIDTNYKKLIIAYEPIWAIGTGKTPTAQEIAEIHYQIKQLSTSPLLYGGSVKTQTIKELINIKNVDGVLVGGASLNVESFCTIIQD